jgi:predicted Zn finger-like uncharacterized protein
MRVQCPQCGVGGNIPDEKIPATGRKIVCPECKTSFFVQKEAAAAVAENKRTGQDAVMYYKEGVQLLKGKQVDAAIEKFNAAIQVNPEYSDAFRHLGLAYGQKNLWEEAIQVLQKAIEYKPDDVLSLKNLGVAYLRQKRFSEAEQVVQQALQYGPDDEKAQSYLAMAVHGKQQEQQASDTAQKSQVSAGKQEDITKVASSEPADMVTTHRNPFQEFLDKGADFLDNAQYNKAIETFQEAIRLAPNSSDGYFGLGMVYEKRQEWAKAIDAYQKAVELNPNDSLAKVNLRFAKKQKKKFKLKFWKK